MRKVADLDLDVQVDPDAPPSDWDAAIARFLLKFVRKQAARSAGTAAAVAVDLNSTSAESERQER